MRCSDLGTIASWDAALRSSEEMDLSKTLRIYALR